MRLSKGHQEMKISYFGSLRGIDYLAHTMGCVTTIFGNGVLLSIICFVY